MVLDCFDFYLWTIGELVLSPEETKALRKEMKRLLKNKTNWSKNEE